MQTLRADTRITLIKGDITEIAVDAIVNAANSSLLGGGGVDGAIHRVGGPQILNECLLIRSSQGGCEPGEAVITGGGRLPASYVIHTVGPIWQGGAQNEDELLANCYRNSLRLAIENGIKTVAFPSISTGVYHFPKDRAARIAIETVYEVLAGTQAIERVIFVCFDAENYGFYDELLKKYQPIPAE